MYSYIKIFIPYFNITIQNSAEAKCARHDNGGILTDSIDFDDKNSFSEKVNTVKESYFKKKAVKSELDNIEEDTAEDNTVETSGSMSQYLSALKSQIKT